jgi:cysteinyl-tRNA synthetase
LSHTVSDWKDLCISCAGVDPVKVEGLIAERTEAKASKDFARADAIRDELTAMGVEIMDGPEGTTWKVAP